MTVVHRLLPALVPTMLLVSMTGCNDSGSGTQPTTIVATTTTEPAASTTSESTEPSTTTAPTTTAPTTTPPTTVPTISAAPFVSSPVTFSGSGDELIDIGTTDRFVLHATFTSQPGINGEFSVQALGKDGRHLTIPMRSPFDKPSYDGYALLGTDPASVGFLRVRADGDWTLELLTADDLATTIEPAFAGHGDQVVRYDGAGGDYTVAFTGNSEFAVKLVAGGVTTAPINVNGDFAGSLTLPPGPVVIAFSGDGDWTVTHA